MSDRRMFTLLMEENIPMAGPSFPERKIGKGGGGETAEVHDPQSVSVSV